VKDEKDDKTQDTWDANQDDEMMKMEMDVIENPLSSFSSCQQSASFSSSLSSLSS
jgi:hypothetical protein